MKKFFTFVILSLLISACSNSSRISYSQPITPESLLDKSSERVAFALTGQTALEEMTEWINNDQPSRAELACGGEDICAEAEEVLAQFGVPVANALGKPSGAEVALFYDRVFTRNCEGHGHNFGCAVSANMVQMVADPQQLLDPTLLDLQDAERAASVYGSYLGSKDSATDNE